MKTKLFLILTAAFIVPQVAFAAWWNPFTWFTNSRTEVLEKRIDELEKMLNKATSTAVDNEKRIINSASTNYSQKINQILPQKDTTSNIVKTIQQSEKDYKKEYQDLRVAYSDLISVVGAEVQGYRGVSPTRDSLRTYSTRLSRIFASLQDDNFTLANYEKTSPKQLSVINDYTNKLNNTKSAFYSAKQGYKDDVESEFRSDTRNAVVSFIKQNRSNLYITPPHVTAASLLDSYDRVFDTKYYESFILTKTQTETMEFADHFLYDLGEI